MQVSYFSCGGFVIHKIPTRAGVSNLSAWYDKNGILVDCEATNVLGRSFKPSKVDKELCQRIGKTYAK